MSDGTPTAKPSLDGLRIDRSREEERGGRGPFVAAVVVLVVGAGALAAWLVSRPGVAEVTTAVAREVTAGAASGGTGGGAAVVLNATGYVTARRRATVSSKVPGKVVEVLFEEGTRVAEGQILARLDPSSAEKALALARSRLDATRASLEEMRVLLAEAELKLGRVRRLVADGVASDEDLDAARARVDSLSARLEAGRQEVEVAEREVALRRQDLDDTVVRAPFAGVAISKDAQEGEMISPVAGGGGYTRTGIGTLVDMGSLEIEVDVAESYIPRVRPGQPVEAILDAYPDWRIPAEVITTIPAADRQKATMTVRIAFGNAPAGTLDPRILPDMGVKVAFLADPTADDGTGTAARRVLVPRAAVREVDGRDVVFVVDGDTVERRAVRTGRVEAGDVEILSGLAGGERVVVAAPEALADGDRVEVVEDKEDQAT